MPLRRATARLAHEFICLLEERQIPDEPDIRLQHDGQLFLYYVAGGERAIGVVELVARISDG